MEVWIIVIKLYVKHVMHRDVVQDRANVSYSWAARTKQLLDELVFSNVWNNKHDMFTILLGNHAESCWPIHTIMDFKYQLIELVDLYFYEQFFIKNRNIFKL